MGVISVLVVFPINFVVVTFFRKARLKEKRPSRIRDAMEKNRLKMSTKSKHMAFGAGHVPDTGEESRQTLFREDVFLAIRPEGIGVQPVINDRHHSDHHDTQSSVSTEHTSIETSSSIAPQLTTVQNDAFEQDKPLEPTLSPSVTQDHNSTTAKPQDIDAKTDKKKKKMMSLPWWFRIVAWVLLWFGTLTCVTFVTFYGIMFGDEKTRKWITSLVISFLTSIFLTQPIKVSRKAYNTVIYMKTQALNVIKGMVVSQRV